MKWSAGPRAAPERRQNPCVRAAGHHPSPERTLASAQRLQRSKPHGPRLLLRIRRTRAKAKRAVRRIDRRIDRGLPFVVWVRSQFPQGVEDRSIDRQIRSTPRAYTRTRTQSSKQDQDRDPTEELLQASLPFTMTHAAHLECAHHLHIKYIHSLSSPQSNQSTSNFTRSPPPAWPTPSSASPPPPAPRSARRSRPPVASPAPPCCPCRRAARSPARAPPRGRR